MRIKSTYCKSCGKEVLAQTNQVNHLLHLVLSFLTGGVWLVVWLTLSLWPKTWRCGRCGGAT